MDLVRFEAAANELLGSLGARLSAKTQESVRTYLWSGEEGLAVDEIAGVLHRYQVPIDGAERDLLRELLDAFDLDGSEDETKSYPYLSDRERVLAELNIVA